MVDISEIAALRVLNQAQWPKDQDAWAGYCVYIVQEDETGFLKIGRASHPTRRLSSLQNGNSRRLFLRGVFVGTRDACVKAERVILGRLKHHQLRGEWVDCDMEAVCLVMQEYVDLF